MGNDINEHIEKDLLEHKYRQKESKKKVELIDKMKIENIDNNNKNQKDSSSQNNNNQLSFSKKKLLPRSNLKKNVSFKNNED